MNDAELMRRTAAGDTESFRVLVERYQRNIFNFFLRSTGNTEDAEDLSQTLFLNLFKSAARYRETASFNTYIFRIAANIAASFARKGGSVKVFSLEEESGETMELEDLRTPDPVTGVETSELEKRYLEALSRLPADMKIAMELRVAEGFTYKEIAGIMGKSVPAVESIIFRARKRLAAALADLARGSNE